MKYNIIGDIHGRTAWENLVDPTCINIFVGDYFDPYDRITIDELETNFLNIMQFAKTNPSTILLLGNHDCHYIYGGESTRFDMRNEDRINKLLLDHMYMFHGIVYNINEDIIISHAGVTTDWLTRSGYSGPITMDNVAKHANNIFWDGYTETSDGQCGWGDNPRCRMMYHLTFRANAKFSDYYGTSPGHSPIWVRPSALVYNSAFTDNIQIVGHTKARKLELEADELICKTFTEDGVVKNDGRIILVDVLENEPAQSLVIDYRGPGDYDFEIRTANKQNDDE